jgi:hypothetical protein
MSVLAPNLLQNSDAFSDGSVQEFLLRYLFAPPIGELRQRRISTNAPARSDKQLPLMALDRGGTWRGAAGSVRLR